MEKTDSENTNELQFSVKCDATIIGGYPADATKGALSNPFRYKTIFSGDFKNDDILFLTPFEKHKERDSVSLSNHEEDSKYLFNISAPKHLILNNSQFIGASHAVFYSSDSVALELKYCRFFNNGGGAVYSAKPCRIRIDSCIFLCNSSVRGQACVFTPNASNVYISNSLFEKNGQYGRGTGGAINVQTGIFSNLFLHENVAQITAGFHMSSEGLVYNCVFIENTSKLHGTAINFPSGRGNVNNCTYDSILFIILMKLI